MGAPESPSLRWSLQGPWQPSGWSRPGGQGRCTTACSGCRRGPQARAQGPAAGGGTMVTPQEGARGAHPPFLDPDPPPFHPDPLPPPRRPLLLRPPGPACPCPAPPQAATRGRPAPVRGCALRPHRGTVRLVGGGEESSLAESSLAPPRWFPHHHPRKGSYSARTCYGTKGQASAAATLLPSFLAQNSPGLSSQA